MFDKRVKQGKEISSVRTVNAIPSLPSWRACREFHLFFRLRNVSREYVRGKWRPRKRERKRMEERKRFVQDLRRLGNESATVG